MTKMIPKKKKFKKAKWSSEEALKLADKRGEVKGKGERERYTQLKRQRNQKQIANIHWIMEKAKKVQKNIYFCFID